MNKIKKEYTKEMIDRWDPIDLLPFAPPDEYDPETKKIYAALNGLDSIDVDSLGQIIYSVFVKAFGDDVFLKNLDECKDVAEDIIQLAIQ